MPAQWTADLIGKMHIYGITAKALAKEIGWHEKYLSAIMNGHKEPRSAEASCMNALQRLIDQHTNDTTTQVP